MCPSHYYFTQKSVVCWYLTDVWGFVEPSFPCTILNMQKLRISKNVVYSETGVWPVNLMDL